MAKQKELLVSVMMPCYNTAQYIGKAIDSLLQSTYTHWELVIVDDGSTDDTLNIAKQYAKDSRIKVFEQNKKGCAFLKNWPFLLRSIFSLMTIWLWSAVVMSNWRRTPVSSAMTEVWRRRSFPFFSAR